MSHTGDTGNSKRSVTVIVPCASWYQVDLARTWLDFTLATIEAAATIGTDLTHQEHCTLYRYWTHLGRLLGIGDGSDPGLLAGVADVGRAGRRLGAGTPEAQ